METENTMKILVTGGTGNVGEYVVNHLVAHDMEPVVTDLKPLRDSQQGLEFVECNLMDLDATVAAIKGYDVVVHLAAIPNAFIAPPEHVMSVNMTTCYNVLEAVRRNGIPRVVYAGSESSTGFGIHLVDYKPLYLPIDEAHPCWPHESYSFTKWFGEIMLENYCKAFGFEGIALRYCGVWTRQEYTGVKPMLEAIDRDGMPEKPSFGCYVAAQDVAQAVRLSINYQFPKQDVAFDNFFIMAESTMYPEPTLDVMRRIYVDLPEMHDPTYYEANPRAQAFDIRKAKERLGYEPKFDCRQIDEWEGKV